MLGQCWPFVCSGGSPPFRVPKTKKRQYFGRNMIMNASFEASDFKKIRGIPLEHISARCGVYELLQQSAPPVCHFLDPPLVCDVGPALYFIGLVNNIPVCSSEPSNGLKAVKIILNYQLFTFKTHVFFIVVIGARIFYFKYSLLLI